MHSLFQIISTRIYRNPPIVGNFFAPMTQMLYPLRQGPCVDTQKDYCSCTMVISEIMTSTPASAQVTDTVAKALATLHNMDVRHLPVVDQGEIVGILSDRDLRSFSELDIFDPEQLEDARAKLKTPISEVMATDLVTLGPESEVSEAIDVMLTEGVGAIPIVDKSNNSLVGILSYVDVLRSLRSQA